MEACAAPLARGELDCLVDTMPAGLLVEDERGRILWVNTTFSHYIGKTFEQLHGTMVADLPLTRVPGVGGNPDYCQIDCPRRGGPEWLLCTRQRLSHANGRDLTARYYLDATEHRRVQRFRGLQVSLQYPSGVTDQVTGTLDRAGIMQTLESEVSRSRRYHNPLAIIQLRLEVSGTDGAGDGVDRLMSAMARVLREQTRWVDRIGRWSVREFLMVLPESDARAATRLAEKVQRHVWDRQIADLGDDLSLATVHVGIAEWQRGNNVSTLLEHAGAQLTAHDNVNTSHP